MSQKPSISSVNGRIIRIAHVSGEPGNPKSYVSSASAASAVTLTVADNGGFADTQLVRVGYLNSPTCEIVAISGAVTHGTSLTVSAMTFAHSFGEPVERVLADQWKIYGNSTASETGAALVATIDQTPNNDYTSYVNAGTEYAYYLVRGYDSVNASELDDYSDAVSQSGHSEDTVGYVTERALEETGVERGGMITDRWLVNQVNDCLKEMRRRLKNWSYVQSFGYALGQTARGVNTFTLPTNIGDRNSNKSILNVYLDGHDEPMSYMDREQRIDEMGQAVMTTVRTQATAGDTTLAVVDSYGLPDEGTVTFYVSGTEYSITYTGVTRSSTVGVLTGVPASGTGAITVTVPVSTNVWYGQQEGEPDLFEVSDGTMTIWPLPDDDHDDLNLRIDYYTDRIAVDSYGDTLGTSAYDLVLHWLKWKLRGTKNALGTDDLTDPDYLQFAASLKEEIGKEISGQRRRWRPKINRITY